MMDRWTVVFMLFVLCSAGAMPEEDDPAELQDAIWAWALHEQKVLNSQELNSCVGRHLDAKWDMVKRSFPQAWPAKGSEDGFCGTKERAVDALCNQADLSFYLQFILKASNPEEIPNRGACGTDNSGLDGCQPGFFSYQGVTRPCCDGFFCPPMVTCMIPCPLGASCVRATPQKPPPIYGNGTWCAPYAYKTRHGRCGGADKWTIIPNRRFSKGDWAFGIGTLYCTKGHYCPNTTTEPVLCPKEYHCREGSDAPAWCPPLAKCKGGTEMPQANYTGIIFLIVVFFSLGLLLQLSRLRGLRLRRLQEKKQRSPDGLEGGVGTYSTEPTSFKTLMGEVWTTFVSGWLIYLGRKQTCLRNEAEPTVLSENSDDGSQNSLELGSPHQNLMDTTMDGQGFAMFGDYSLDLDAAGLAATRFKIEFYGLSLQLKSRSKHVLRSASGVLPESKLTAIMGPSGSGKTSLLNALSGKAGYGTVSGVILVNGEEASLEEYKGVMGFVPQDDIMHTDLTVQENLLFSAKYRLPAGTTHFSIMCVVERALEVLGLNNVRHELIGDQMNRGISGGQRKRVNVGLEIVADPLVLFLDEPTSGLDSSSCKQVVSALRTIAHLGVTTAAVVHQPSHRVMRLFDNLLLLGNGGSTIYNGTEDKMQDYFESLGFEFPSRANPADVVMDITTGQHKLPGNPEFKPEDLFTSWRESENFARSFTNPELECQASSASIPPIRTPMETFEVEAGTISDGSEWGSGLSSFSLRKVSSVVEDFVNHVLKVVIEGCTWMQKVVVRLVEGGKVIAYEEVGSGSVLNHHRRTPGFCHQFWWCLCRTILKTFRAPVQLFIEYFIFAALGAALGYMADMRTNSQLLIVEKDVTYNFVAVGLLSSISGLRAFGLSQEIFYRESARGINRLAHFLALDIVGVMKTIVHGLCYLLPYYYFALPRATFRGIYFVIVSLMYSWTGSAYITSQLMGYSSSQLASAVLVLLHALLSRPKPNIPVFMHQIRSLVFTWWALKAIMITEASHLVGVWLLERCSFLIAMDFKADSYGLSMFLLIFFGVLARLIAWCLLRVVNRDKQL